EGGTVERVADCATPSSVPEERAPRVEHDGVEQRPHVTVEPLPAGASGGACGSVALVEHLARREALVVEIVREIVELSPVDERDPLRSRDVVPDDDPLDA